MVSLVKIIADSRDRPTWLEARKPYVCGSECAPMLGEGKGDNNTRAQLVMLKAGLAEPWEGNETSQTGQDLEDSGYYQLATKRKWGWNLEPFGMLVEDPMCSDLAATPDFLVQAPWGMGVVQAKGSTTQAQEDIKPIRKDGTPSEATYVNGAPVHYVLQIQAELAVTGLQWGALLVLHAAKGAWKLRSYPVRRHEGIITRLRHEAPKVMAEARALMAGKLRVG